MRCEHGGLGMPWEGQSCIHALPSASPAETDTADSAEGVAGLARRSAAELREAALREAWPQGWVQEVWSARGGQ